MTARQEIALMVATIALAAVIVATVRWAQMGWIIDLLIIGTNLTLMLGALHFHTWSLNNWTLTRWEAVAARAVLLLTAAGIALQALGRLWTAFAA